MIVVVGRAKWVWDVERPEGGDGKGEKRLKVGVSWSVDHRIMEGTALALFVECWRSYVGEEREEEEEEDVIDERNSYHLSIAFDNILRRMGRYVSLLYLPESGMGLGGDGV